MIWNPTDCSCLSCSQKGGRGLENDWLTLIPGKVNRDKPSSFHRKTEERTQWACSCEACQSKISEGEDQMALSFIWRHQRVSMSAGRPGRGYLVQWNRMRGWLSGWRNPNLRDQETKKTRQHVESLEEEEECWANSMRSEKAEKRDLWEIPSRGGDST